MDRAEIIEGLESASLWLPLVPGTEIPERAAIKAAIALLTPEPVTEEGLRKLEFRECAAYFSRDVTETISVVYWRSTGAYEIYTNAGVLTCIPLHIESMQQLREVIKALRGTTNESEASE